MTAHSRISPRRRGPHISTWAIVGAAVLLTVAAVRRLFASAAGFGSRIVVRHVRWLWRRPTVISKVAVVVADGILGVIAVQLLPAPTVLKQTLLTVGGLGLAFVLVASILFHSDRGNAR